MPELPDVAGFKTYVDATALHQTIVKTKIEDDRILKNVKRRSLQQKLRHVQLQSIRRSFKFLFVALSTTGHLVLHFGITGALSYYGTGDPPRFTRLLSEFGNGYHPAYQSMRMLGEVGFTYDQQAFIASRKLGPDALSPAFDETDFIARFAGRRGTLKSALMNQALIAGIGNVYSDKILFQAGLHPAIQIDCLNREQLASVYAVMRRVLTTASRCGADVTKLPEDYLLPYRDAMGPCPRCGGTLNKARVAGRTARITPVRTATGSFLIGRNGSMRDCKKESTFTPISITTPGATPFATRRRYRDMFWKRKK